VHLVPVCVVVSFRPVTRKILPFLSSWVASKNKNLSDLVNVRGAVSGSPVALCCTKWHCSPVVMKTFRNEHNSSFVMVPKVESQFYQPVTLNDIVPVIKNKFPSPRKPQIANEQEIFLEFCRRSVANLWLWHPGCNPTAAGGLVKELIMGFVSLRLLRFSPVIIIISMLQNSVHSAYFSAK